MTSWATLTANYPLFGHVTALVDDGVFVRVGAPGVIVGREQRDDELWLEIRWHNDTKTTVICTHIERAQNDEAA